MTMFYCTGGDVNCLNESTGCLFIVCLDVICFLNMKFAVHTPARGNYY